MDPSIARELRKSNLEKRKAKVALAIREPSGAQVMVTPNLFDAPEVHPPIVAKHPRLTRGEGSSSVPLAAAS